MANEVNVIASSVAYVPNGEPHVAAAAADVAAAAADVAAGKGISDVAASVIRTLTPIIVGGGITLLATSTGVHVPAAYEHVVDEGATLALGGAYYFLVRKIEAKYPKAGWLLGVPKAPVYGA